MLDPATAQRLTSQSSPGPAGYALAVTISFLALVMEFGVIAYLDPQPGWGVLNTTLTVLFAGFVPAGLIGAVGATFVHLATWRAKSQWPSVVLAGLLGLLVGWNFFEEPLLVSLMGFNTAAGRLAVFPMAHRRSRTPD